MNKFLIFSLLILLFSTRHTEAQIRTISGIITGSDGQPLPGVSISIKGTSTGTITDLEGFYTIDAEIGSTLVYSYVGFLNKEVVVEEDSGSATARIQSEEKIKSENKKVKNPFMMINKHHGKGIGNFSHVTVDESNRVLKQTSHQQRNKNQWYIGGQVKSAYSFDRVRNLPPLQHQYSQGRPINGEPIWRGAETGEIFSWGPAIQNLEYNGMDYSYDHRGQLVPKGNGNGLQAKPYDPYLFFRTGKQFNQKVNLSAANPDHLVSLSYDLNTYKGVFPKSGQNSHHLGLKSDIKLTRSVSTKLKLKFFESESHLMNDLVQTRIYSMLQRTPRTFDLTNGADAGKAVNDPDAFLLSNGNQRSYALNVSDNPYWLINHITDDETKTMLTSSMKTSADLFNDLKLTLDIAYNFTTLNNQIIFPQGISGFNHSMDFNRRDIFTHFLTIGRIEYHKAINYRHNMSCSFTSGYNQYELDQETSFLQEAAIDENLSYNHSSLRYIWESSLKLNYDLHNILLTDLNLNFINSSTSNKKYLTPLVGLGLKLPGSWYIPFINDMKITGSWSISILEPSVHYRRGLMNSVRFSSHEFDRYFEYYNVLNAHSVDPEIRRKFEAGFQMEAFNNRIQTSFYYYQNKSINYSYPVFHENEFHIENVADLASHGIDLDINLNLYNYYWSGRSFRWFTGIHFHKSHTVVKKLHRGEILTGGFSDVSSMLIEGQPYGVITGNDFMKNDHGEILIGWDGFPIVDPERKILGNPNPDYILGFSNQINFRRIRLSFVFEARIGGKIWNGTKNNLEYLGLSTATEKERLILNYIFEGINPDGLVNNTQVSFYDPSLPVSENRWVRYGPSGVPSAAIEDATSIRLSSFNLSYTFNRDQLHFGSSLEVAIFGSDLFHAAGYQGPDPQNMLLGFSNNVGFDYFNLPPITSFGASVNFKF